MRVTGMSKQHEMVGKIFPTNNGGDCIVVEYNGWDNVTVEFLDSHRAKVTTQMTNIRNGQVSNPYAKSVLGVGYLGEGVYKVEAGGKPSLVYYTWRGMIERGYSKKLHEKYPTYKDCTVCDEWHNFQVFAEWYTNHESFGLGYELDKDILVKDNKHYSPQTCCLIPAEINSFFNTCDKRRGEYPLGVGYHKTKKTFYASVRDEGKLQHLGHYRTPEEAFEVYKEAKECLVKGKAFKYEGKIEDKVFDMLMFWTVE